MSKRIGYIRVSSASQNTTRQLDNIELDKIFEEKISGKNTQRPALQELINYVREGDSLFVHSIDRLARSLKDLHELIATFKENGVSVSFVKNNLTFSSDTNSPTDNLMLNMLGSFAEFERELIKERQAEGIAKAKEAGKYSGRKETIDRDRLRQLISEGKKPSVIQTELGISKASFYMLKANLCDG